MDQTGSCCLALALGIRRKIEALSLNLTYQLPVAVVDVANGSSRGVKVTPDFISGNGVDGGVVVPVAATEDEAEHVTPGLGGLSSAALREEAPSAIGAPPQ